jgi:hypothetical protein
MESWGAWRTQVRKAAEELALLMQEARDEGQLVAGESLINEVFGEQEVPVQVFLIENSEDM